MVGFVSLLLWSRVKGHGTLCQRCPGSLSPRKHHRQRREFGQLLCQGFSYRRPGLSRSLPWNGAKGVAWIFFFFISARKIWSDLVFYLFSCAFLLFEVLSNVDMCESPHLSRFICGRFTSFHSQNQGSRSAIVFKECSSPMLLVEAQVLDSLVWFWRPCGTTWTSRVSVWRGRTGQQDIIEAVWCKEQVVQNVLESLSVTHLFLLISKCRKIQSNGSNVTKYIKIQDTQDRMCYRKSQ